MYLVFDLPQSVVDGLYKGYEKMSTVVKKPIKSKYFTKETGSVPQSTKCVQCALIILNSLQAVSVDLLF